MGRCIVDELGRWVGLGRWMDGRWMGRVAGESSWVGCGVQEWSLWSREEGESGRGL